MASVSDNTAQDARFLVRERIVDALLRALALKEPELLNAIRSILIDTEFTHSGKPGEHETVREQIRSGTDSISPQILRMPTEPTRSDRTSAVGQDL